MSDLITHIKSINAQTAAWVALNPENNHAGMLVETVDHWADHGVHTVEDFKKYEIQCVIWDLYKEINGCRPHGMDFTSMALDDLNAILSILDAQLDSHNELNASMAQDAREREENEITALMASQNIDRETAKRWIGQITP